MAEHLSLCSWAWYNFNLPPWLPGCLLAHWAVPGRTGKGWLLSTGHSFHLIVVAVHRLTLPLQGFRVRHKQYHDLSSSGEVYANTASSQTSFPAVYLASPRLSKQVIYCSQWIDVAQTSGHLAFQTKRTTIHSVQSLVQWKAFLSPPSGTFPKVVCS